MVDLILFEALACEAFEEVRDTGSAFAGKFRLWSRESVVMFLFYEFHDRLVDCL